MKFDKRLRKLRKEKNIKQKDLALFLDVSTPTITKYESGDRVPTTDKLVKIADYFDVSLDYLIGRSNKKTISSGFKENMEPLIDTLDIPDEQVQVIKESQLHKFIDNNFDGNIWDIKDLKIKLAEDDNFQLEDYTEEELKKVIKDYGKNDSDFKPSEKTLNKIKNFIKDGKKKKDLNKMKLDLHKIPVIHEMTTPEIYDNKIDNYLNAPTFEIQNKNYFYLEVNDDSMSKARIQKRDTILVRKQNELKNGSIGLVWLKNENQAVIRSINKFIAEDNHLYFILQPYNTKYDSKVFKNDEIKIIGKVIEVKVGI